LVGDVTDTPQFARNNESKNNAWLKTAILQGIVMGFAFALTYWGLYKLLQPSSQQSDSSAKTLVRQQTEYDEQMKTANEMTERARAVLAKQEEQAKRMDAVISAWEKQSNIKK
jgi:hypothetical protein